MPHRVSTLGVIAAAWLAGLGLASALPEGEWRLGVGLAGLTLGALAAFLGASPSSRRQQVAAGVAGLAALLAGLGARLETADLGAEIGLGEVRL